MWFLCNVVWMLWFPVILSLAMEFIHNTNFLSLSLCSTICDKYCSDLTKKNIDFKKQISDAETASKLGDSEIVPLRFQVNRLESEVAALTKHSTWLESENKSKDTQLSAVRTETSSELAELRADYDRVLSDKETAESSLASEREHTTKLQSNNERLQRQLLQVRNEATENKLALEQELVAEKRLVSLQKEQLDRDKRRYNDAIQEYSSLRQSFNPTPNVFRGNCFRFAKKQRRTS